MFPSNQFIQTHWRRQSSLFSDDLSTQLLFWFYHTLILQKHVLHKLKLVNLKTVL